MELKFPLNESSRILTWRVKEGAFVKKGHVIFEFAGQEEKTPQRFKATEAGVVKGILARRGDTIVKGTPLLVLEPCTHPTVFSDMCGKCGADLAKLDSPSPATAAASSYVSMIHSVPGLKVSLKDAKSIDKNEEGHLLQRRQLRLLVDLDQTLIHTTNDNVPQNLRDVFHFQLWGHGSVWYHTRLRPRTLGFLERISKLYQLHICTFGSRNYAHVIARHLDPSGNYFYNRILSRDECFSQNSKTANLKELFPNGDHMVCIIDDREDVWNYGPNLIHVKPYHFFRHTGDINAPPGFTKKDEDDKTGFDFTAGTVKKTEKPIQANADSTSDITTKKSVDPEKPKPKSDVKDDLSLSDDDEDEVMESVAEEKANDGDSESSSNEDTTTESDTETDTSKVQDVNLSADSEPEVKLKSKSTTKPTSEPTTKPKLESDSTAEANPESDLTAEAKPESDSTSTAEAKPESDSTAEVKLEENTTEKVISQPADTDAEAEPKLENNIDIDKPVEIVPATSTASTSNEQKREDGELSDSSVSAIGVGQEVGTVVATVSPVPVIPVIASPAERLQPNSNDIIEVEDEDDYLLYLEDILKQIHEAFYKLHDDMKARGNGEVPDVKNVIPYVRRKVLKGCSIVFSGVVPVDHILERSRPYSVATSLGAQVSDKIIPPPKHGGASASTSSTATNEILPTTHIVAARLGTAKVNDARRYKGVHVVTPNWLWCCAERWERVNEKLFSLCKKSNVKRHPPPHCSSPESSFGQSRDSFEMITPLESQDSDADAVFSVQSPGTSSSVNRKNGQPAARRGRTPSGRFMDTINPLFSFSMDDIESMGQEVDDICNESESSSTSSSESELGSKTEKVVRKKKKPSVNSSIPGGLKIVSPSQSSKGPSSSSETSDEEKIEALRAVGLNSRKRRREPKTETETEDEPLSARFRRGEALPSDLDILNLTNPSTDDDNEGNEEDQEDNSWMVRELEQELLCGDDSMDMESS